MENFKCGSIWRKWNLHLHSKYSGEQSTSMEIKNIFELAIKKQLSMISITDHSNVNGLDEIWDVYNNHEINYEGTKRKVNELIEFLPGIELTTDSGRSGIHIIVVFPKKIYLGGNLIDSTTKNIRENFCSCLGITEAKIENLGNGNYNEGLLKIKVNLDKTVELAHKLGGKVIIHGGDKHKSIEEEMTHEVDPSSAEEVYKNLGLKKEEIISKKIDVIELPNINKNNAKNMRFYNDTFDKPCIISSDSHTKEDYEEYIDKKSSWIKSDLSFDGFKQAIIDYKERIEIIDIPEQLLNNTKNKTKYIKELHINWEENYTGKFGKWFKELSIPLNYGLISIIGNKGSGKTALAEIIALICNSNRKNDFNFLTSKKFGLKHLSNNFYAELSFYDEQPAKRKNLGDTIEEGSIELAQFIPQNYFEKICDTIQNEHFSEELNRVVFSKMKEEDREGTDSFEELTEKYRISTNKEVTYLKNALREKNRTIINLEKQQNPTYLKNLINQLEQLNNENEMILKLKPKVIKFPKMSESSKKEYQDLKNKQDIIDKEIENIENKIIKNKTDLKEIEYIKQEINNTINRFKNDIEHLNENLIKFKLKTNDIIKISIEYADLDTEYKRISKELEKNRNRLEIDKKEKSLKSKKNEISEKIEKIVKNSQTSIAKYEKNQLEIKDWNKKIEISKAKILEIKKEIDYISSKLPGEMKVLRDERTQISRNIYERKTEMVNLFNRFKKPIDTLIEENSDLLREYNLGILSGHFIIDKFEETFFDFINKNKKNVFRDTNYTMLEKINNDYDVNNIEIIIKFANDIVKQLESGDEIFIHDQIKEKRIEEFYEYLFSFEYLEEKYNLSTFNKSLDSLSPGERGALLLVFYLLIDDRDIPLILDQPEDNLDNQSISTMLVPFIKKARKHRQIIVVTHNPNISVVSDSDQVIYVNINKEKENLVEYISGAIENPHIKERIVQIQEGTVASFKKREVKYDL